MIEKLRHWLARIIIGRSLRSRFLFSTTMMTRAMRDSGSDYIEWETADGSVYMAGDMTDEVSGGKIRCTICTNVFEGDADAECECPMCGSRDCKLI